MNIPDFSGLRGNKLGEAIVEIKADAKGYFNALDKAGLGLRSFSSAAPGLLKGVGVAFAGVTAAAAGLAAGITAIAVKGLREYSAFQQGAAEQSTLLRDNVDSTMNALSRGVRDLSLQIPQSTALMNKALYDIISAGVDAGKSLDVLGLSGRAAVAGVSEIGTAAKLGTSTINALGMATEDMEKVFDIAFGTVRSGVTTFAELAASIGDVLPPASKLGVNINELFGSMAYLTKVGQSSAEASTALGRAFEALIAHSAELEGFGVNVFGSKGEFVGVLNVMRQISGVIDGLSEKERADVLEQMGITEIRAQRAIIPMITNFEAFEKVVQDVTNSGGAMEEAYSRMLGTLVNQWTLLENATSELRKAIGEHFADIAKSAIGNVTDVVIKIGKLIGSSEGGLGQVWADHAELVQTIFTQMAITGIEIISAMVVSMGKTLGQTAKNVLAEAISPKRIKQDYILAFETFAEGIRAIAKGDIQELDDIWQRALLKQDVTLEEYRNKQTSASEMLASSIGEAAQKATNQVRKSYKIIDDRIDEHLKGVISATKETNSAVAAVADSTVKSVANSVRQATGLALPALEDFESAFLAIQDKITMITKYQEAERTKATEKALQTRELVFREYNDNWAWYNNERYEGWKDTTDKILENESTADGVLTRLNARGQSERLGQMQQNAAAITASHQAFADETNAIAQAKNEALIGSEESTAALLEQLDETSTGRRIAIQQQHWHDYVDITADGIGATANAWADLWSIWHNTEMTADKFYSSSIGKLATWVDRVSSLVNNAKTAWDSLNTIISAVKLLGATEGGAPVSALAQAGQAGTVAGTGKSAIGTVAGGVKKGATAVPWGTMASTAAAWTPTAAAATFYALWGKHVIGGLLQGTKTKGIGEQWERAGFGSEEAWRQYEALADEVNRSFAAHQAQARAQQQAMNREGQRQNEQIMLELARYSQEELRNIYQNFPDLRTYITPTWDTTTRRGLAGGAYGQTVYETNINAGVIVADEYSIREFGERIARYLKEAGYISHSAGVKRFTGRDI